MKPLDTRSNQQIVDVLAPLMAAEQDRRALLTLTFINHPLLSQIDFSGSMANFLPNMIEKLYQFGKLDDGRPALWTLLEVVREQVGLDQKHLIDALRPAFELPPPPRLDRIFVSYSRQNERDAQRIVSDLKDAGLRVWFDREKIKAGEEWWRSIERGIINADFFVFCISPSAIESDIAKKELITARQNKKPIYAIMLEDCWAQINDKNAFAHKYPEIPWLTDLHIIDFIQPERYGDRLRELIQSLPGYTPPDTYFIEQMDTRDLPNPFRGLEAFLELDADYFFGRDDAIKQLLNQVSDLGRSRLLAVVGASGSGKSSLVRAGLIPALRDTLPFWETLTIRPGNTPLNDLADRLQLRLGFEVEHVRERLREHVSALDDIAAELMMGKPEDARFVLVIDQFEELFTLTSKEECTVMLDLLIYAVERLGGRVQVIMTMRADFFDRLSSFPGLASLVRENLYIATEMHSDQLRHSIEDPARKVSVTYEDGLVENILDDVREQPGSLPLLQYALKALFERKVGRRMTHDAYQSIGGVKQALATRAEIIYTALNSEQQESLRLIMLRLIEVEDETITRRRVTQSELVFNSIPYEITNEILKSLTDAENRLLVVSAAIDDAEDGQKYYEVSHEALLSYWDRLKGWIAEKHDDLHLDGELRRAASEWDNSNRNKDFLLQGTRLAVAQEWSLRFDAPTQLQRDFIQVSAIKQDRDTQHERERQAREIQLQKRALNRARILAAAFAIFLVVAIGLSLFALDRQSQAENSASFAETQAALAATSEANAFAQSTLVAQQRDRAESLRLASEANVLVQAGDGNRETAALLSVRALELDQTARAQNSLQDALANFTISKIFRPPQYDDAIRIAPDSQHMLIQRDFSNEDEDDLLLIDLETGETVQRFSGHKTGLTKAIFSDNGHYLLSSDIDYNIILWNVDNGQLLHTFLGHNELIAGLAFSPDNSTILTGDASGQVFVWDTQSGEQVGSFKAGLLLIDIAFLPDGVSAATVSFLSGVDLWDVTTGTNLRRHFGSGSAALLISQDGNGVFTGNNDGSVTLWNLETGEEEQRFEGHTSSVTTMGISVDGALLVTGGGSLNQSSAETDTTIRVWNVLTGENVKTLTGHNDAITQVTFDRDETGIILSLSEQEDLVRRWSFGVDRRVTSLASGEGFLQSLDASVDGQHVATIHAQIDVGSDVIADMMAGLAIEDDILNDVEGIFLTVWEIETGNQVFQLDIQSRPASNIRYSPDGQYLFTYRKSNQNLDLWVYDASDGTLLYSEEYNGDEITFSPDGQRFVVSNFGGKSTYLVETESGQVLQEIATVENGLTSLFSHDGRYLLTFNESIQSEESNVFLWNAMSGELVHSIRWYIGDNSYEVKADFSQNGEFFLLAYLSQLSIWETSTGSTLDTIDPSASYIGDARFTLDSKNVIIGYDFASGKEEAEMYQLDNGKIIQTYEYGINSVDNIYISPDGTTVLFEFTANPTSLFDIHSGSLTAEIPRGRVIGRGPIYEWSHHRVTIFSPEGTTFITRGESEIYIWDSHTGELLDVSEPPTQINTLQDVVYAGNDFLITHINNFNLNSGNLLTWNVMQAMTAYDAWIDYACSVIPRDLTPGERGLYLISDNAPTCKYDFTTDRPSAIIQRLYSDGTIPNSRGYLVEQFNQNIIDLSEYDNTTRWIPTNGEYISYVVGATVEWGEGSTEDLCGVLFGFQDNDNFIYFGMNQDGLFGFQQRLSGEWEEFSPREGDINLTKGASSENQILLVATDGSATVFVNSQPAGSFGIYDQPELVTGHVGTVGSTFANSDKSSCVFDNIWVWDLAATVPPSPTPTPQPTATPVVSGMASMGENRGQFEIGEGDVWYFSGTPGQTIGIRVTADHPANDSQDRTGLLDTQVFLRAPDGSIIAQADDIEDGKITDSIIESIELPVTGQYEIEVRSYQNATGGQYTLTISSP